jgi:hypothetical protein
MTFGEGARWQSIVTVGRRGTIWVLLPRCGDVAGLVWFNPAFNWCAECAGMAHTGLTFVDAVGVVERAATNVLDEAALALKL